MNVLLVILIIFILSWVFDQILSWLNLRHHTTVVPESLQAHIEAEKYEKAYDYHRVNYRFSLIKSVPGLLIIGTLLAVGGFGWLDTQLQGITTHPVWHPLVFFGVLFFASDILTIPFQWHQTFGIEERFGFNKMTKKTFWIDKLKGWAMTIIIGGLVMGILLLLVDTLGNGFWIWFWIFISLFSIFMNVFYTTLLLPIFNKLTPLETGDLREKIQSYSQSVSFPLDNIFVMDGSKRSSKSNAFFSGLGKRKKVVLFDTLIENHKQEELVAVLAHEVGHYKKKHIIQSLVLGVLQTGLMLFILSRFIQSPALSLALGGQASSIGLNLLAFGILYSPISMLLGILMNIFSRKNEFEADAYAANTYESAPLQQALIQLHADNLSNLTPHPWYVFFHYSHPPLIERLSALERR
ncbi:MAG: M48 family metallopeptidase [Bacteroidota bacterium]